MRTMLTLILALAGLALPADAQLIEQDKPRPPDAQQQKKPKPPRKVQPLTADQQKEAKHQLLLLASTSFGKRERATRRLIDFGPAVGPIVAAALKKSTDVEAKWRMRKVLKTLKLAHLDAATLRESLKDKLAPLGDKLLVTWFSPSHRDKPSVDPRTGAKLFGELMKYGKHAVPILLLEMKTDNARKRANLAYLLGELKNPAACPQLILALDDSDTDVKKLAAWALGRLRHASAIKPLIQLASKTTDKNVQKAAMLSFLPLRNRASIAPLIALLSKGGELGWHANWVLEKLTGHRTTYNAFRPERRDKGGLAWKTWHQKHGKTFKFAYSQPRNRNSLGPIQVREATTVKVIRLQPAKRPVKQKRKKK